MKLFRLFIVLSFSTLILTLIGKAQESLPVIKSNTSTISIKDGKELRKNHWSLTPSAKPDVFEAKLIYGKPHKVTFITDVDSISFNVEEGKKYDFIIKWGDKACYTQIVGKKFIPFAVFDKKYQKEHKGKIFAEVPEVYELLNVAIALTPSGIKNDGLVNQDSDYYKSVREWFDKYQNHPLLNALEEKIKKGTYSRLKINSYAFEFDKDGKIVQSKIYDRAVGEQTNILLPFLSQLQSFSDETNFREFYKQNRKIYDEEIIFFRNTANIAEMKRWLEKNFPTSYDTYKIIFSPLVANNQSTNWFENDGFKELQPHVNFPYPADFKSPTHPLSEKTEIIIRGNIVFTELNHGYINPVGDEYAARIVKAVSNRDLWVDKSKGAGYYPDISAFNEYMNWGLVSLRYVDYMPQEEQERLISSIDRMMTKSRGFLQFTEFNKFLINLYRNRKPHQTIADLYPQIIEWFEKKNEEGKIGAGD